MPSRPADTGLPAEAIVEDVRRALAETGCGVVVAPPGAGKTTVLPLRLLDEPWLAQNRIVMLEPRRVATRAAARRMAALLGEAVGATVGYRTRDERRVGPTTRIEVVTEGILTRRLQSDPSLPGIGALIFDEFHERNLQADLALALALEARGTIRDDLRILVMSATIDTLRVAALIAPQSDAGPGLPAPVIEAQGREHPVEVRWCPAKPNQRIAEATTAVVIEALRAEHGDLLVFLPGAADIRRVEQALASVTTSDTDVRPLHGGISSDAQDLALRPSPPGRRRIVLGTDIAESSLTVEGVRVVVDSGQSRTPHHDAATGLTRLKTGPVSKASAEQRAGRAGRIEPGVAFRLWSRIEHATRRPFAPAEITTVDLSAFALELAVWGTPPAGLRLLDQPPTRAYDEAVSLLRMLGALDAEARPTPLGTTMASLPLHPRLAGMVARSTHGPDAYLACVIAAVLEERDVLRGHPDELPVDLAARIRLVTDSSSTDGRADRHAVRAAATRAREVAKRAGIRPGDVGSGREGRVLALAYPDRIGQARGNARFRLRFGGGAWVPQADPMAAEPFVVAAALDADKRDSRIRIAAALDASDVEEVASADVERRERLVWDATRADLRTHVEVRLGGLVLSQFDAPPEPGPATTAALVERVRAGRLTLLHWTEGHRSFQTRVGFLRRVLGDAWPDVSDAALLASLDDWLPPLLPGATGVAALRTIDVGWVLRSPLTSQQAAAVDDLAPRRLRLPSGRSLAVDYSGAQPSVSVRVQEVFGVVDHPTVAGSRRFPVVFHLLSPAQRPVQITADLPGFWDGSWAEVRREMAGRYPKHSWPADPRTQR